MILQFIAVILLIALDQAVKLWIVGNVPLYSGFPIIRDVLHIFHTRNTGAGWSLLAGQTEILTIIPALASIAMIYVLARKKIKSKTGTWGLSLILSGALGNLIDRVFRGGEVVDMIKFEFINFPVFNVADICVTVGAVLFFVYILFIYDDKGGKKDE